MDAQPDTARKLAELNGLLQIGAATRVPLPSLKTHAATCVSFRALATGIKPMHPVTHDLHMFAIGRELGLTQR